MNVLIVSYRRPDLLERCLRSVREHLAGQPILVWDNHSLDSPQIQQLATAYPDVQWEFSPSNVGFAAAVNGLADKTSAGDLLLLNPDAVLTGPLTSTRSALASGDRVAAAAPSTGGSSPSRRHQPWDVAHRSPTLIRHLVAHAGLAGALRRTALSELYPSAPAEVGGYLTGACLLISRRAWVEVGRFDETFFLYGEEADWQDRARALGWTLRLVEDSDFAHVGHGTVAGDPIAADRSSGLLRASVALRLGKGGHPHQGQAFLAACTALDRVQRSKREQRSSVRTARAAVAEPSLPSVVITTNTLNFGGAERQRVLLAGALAARGYDVTLVCLQRLGPLVREVPVGVRLVRLPYWLPVLDLPPGPTVLISGTTNTEVGFASAWRRSGSKRWWLVAAHNPPRQDAPTYSGALAALVRRSDGVVALSPRHWTELTRHQQLHERHFLAPNGVRLSPSPRKLPDTGEPVRLVFVGRILEEKNPQLLVAALAGLTDLPWQLDIFGNGPDFERLSAQTPVELADRVHWRGWADGPDQALADAEVMCLPSRAEAFPLVVLEAMARGVPVVGSAVCSVPDILDNGAAGVLVDPITVEAWRSALRPVLGDASLRARLGRAGWERASARYTVDEMADAYAAAIAAVLDEQLVATR